VCAKPETASGKAQSPPSDRAIAAIALTQHAVISLASLEQLGLSGDNAGKRVGVGRLHRVHRGVFSIVPPALLTRLGRFMAAVLACGEGAVLSHRSAAVMLDLGARAGRLVDVTAPASRGRRRDGIRVHSAATLEASDVTSRGPIPITTLARTLLDLCEDASRREVERAIDRAELLRALDVAAIDDVLDRAGGRRGAALLADVLAVHRVGTTLTRNELEEAFLRICRTARVPPDAVNAWIPYPDGSGAEADFLWHEHRLIVEVDGRDVHTTRRAFERDRRRDQRLATLGYRVIRFTWRQVTREPAYVTATLVALLRGG
jgi:predicted transcriptional regulator of viral defense system